MEKDKKLLLSSICMIILIVLSKGLALVRETVIAHEYGTSYWVDAYTICLSVIEVIFAIISNGIAKAYIPAKSTSKQNSFYFLSNTMNIMTCVAIIIGIFCFIFSNSIVQLLAPGFSNECKEITSRFVRIVIISMPFMIQFNIMCVYSHMNEHFIYSNFIDYILVSLSYIIIIMIFKDNYTIIWAYVLSNVLACFFMWIYVLKMNNWKYEFVFNPLDKEFVNLIQMSIPFGLSTLINRINTVVDRGFSSNLGEGITSALGYANRIQLIPFGLSTAVILTICYPRICMFFSKGYIDRAVNYVKKANSISLLIMLPVSIIIYIYSKTIIGVIFERGAFDTNSTLITSNCLKMYAVGMPLYALRESNSRVLSANKKQKILLKNTLVIVFVNYILDFLLVSFMNYEGLALATSISGGISLFLIYYEISKLKIKIIDRLFLIDAIKIIVSTVIGIGVGYIISGIFSKYLSDFINVLLSMIISLIIYVILLFIFKTNIFLWMCSQIKDKLGKNE